MLVQRTVERSIVKAWHARRWLTACTRLARERLLDGEVAAWKACIGAVVDAVIVGDSVIQIIGSNDNLTAAIGGKSKPKKVRKSVRDWCASPEMKQTKSSTLWPIGNRF